QIVAQRPRKTRAAGGIGVAAGGGAAWGVGHRGDGRGPFAPMSTAHWPARVANRRSLVYPLPLAQDPKQRCRSSVVEHPLGKGEVESSILYGSTMFFDGFWLPAFCAGDAKCLIRAR